MHGQILVLVLTPKASCFGPFFESITLVILSPIPWAREGSSWGYFCTRDFQMLPPVFLPSVIFSGDIPKYMPRVHSFLLLFPFHVLCLLPGLPSCRVHGRWVRRLGDSSLIFYGQIAPVSQASHVIFLGQVNNGRSACEESISRTMPPNICDRSSLQQLGIEMIYNGARAKILHPKIWVDCE